MSKKLNRIKRTSLDIWSKPSYSKSIIENIKHMKRCIKWSNQRVRRGYCDSDVWDMFGFLQKLIPDMLQTLKDTRHGSPGYLGKTYTNENGIIVNDTCHGEWDKILDKMIFLWKETDEETCSKKNSYEEEYFKAMDDFHKKYGTFGEHLRTKKELEKNKKRGGHTVHFMDELPEYKDITDKYHKKEIELDKYRNACKDEVFNMMTQYFFSLWD